MHISLRSVFLFIASSAFAFGQGSQLPKYTVATLPSASSLPTYTVQVIDGSTASDCSTGGGSYNVICTAHSGSWVFAGGSGGGSVTWPTSADIVISNGTNSPAGLAPSTNGDCAVVISLAWALGNCGSGAGQNGAFPANGHLYMSGPSYLDDDNNNISPPVLLGHYSCTTGSAPYTCTTFAATTHPFVTGQWVNMRGTANFSVGNANFPSYLALGTQYSIFQVTRVNSTEFTFQESFAPGLLCASTCGYASSASFNLPYATWTKLGFSNQNIEALLPSPVNIAGLAANFTSMFPSATTPCVFAFGIELNDIAGGTSASTLEGYYKTIFADAHTLGCSVLVMSAPPYAVGQGTIGHVNAYQQLFLLETWLKSQGPQNSTLTNGQNWDYYADVFGALSDAYNTNLLAWPSPYSSQTGFAFGGADLASSEVATVLFTGKSAKPSQEPLFWGAANGSTNILGTGTVIRPYTDTYGAFQVNDANNDAQFSIDTSNHGTNVWNSTLQVQENSSSYGLSSPLSNVNEQISGGIYLSQPIGWISGLTEPRTQAGQGSSNWIRECSGDQPYGTNSNLLTCWGSVVNDLATTGSGPALNGFVLNTQPGGVSGSGSGNDAMHIDGNGIVCLSVTGLDSSLFTPGTTNMCPNQADIFSIGTSAQFGVDVNGNTTVHNLTVNGACTGCYALTGAVLLSPSGAQTITQPVNTNITFAGSGTGIADFSGFPQFKLPVVAGYAAAASGEIGHDSTNHNWHIWANGVDNFLGIFPSGSPPTSGDCVKFLETSTAWTLADAGAACGSGSGPTIQTNGTNNSSQSALNFITSTTNSVGLTATPSNPTGGNEKFEITGTYTGTATGLSGNIQTNSTNNSTQSTLNFETSTTNSVGLTVTPVNPSGGIEKEEVTGNYSGTLTSSQVTTAVGGALEFEVYDTPYSATMTSGTGAITTLTLVSSPGANTNYRLDIVAVEVSGGSGGTCSTQGTITPQMEWTDADSSTAITTGTLPMTPANTATAAGTNPAIASPGSGQIWGGSRTFRAHSGDTVALIINQTTGSNCTTTPVIEYRPILWQLPG